MVRETACASEAGTRDRGGDRRCLSEDGRHVVEIEDDSPHDSEPSDPPLTGTSVAVRILREAGPGDRASPHPEGPTLAKLRIAHIFAEVPWPPDKGGKISFLNHLTELSDNPRVTTSLVLLDADGDRARYADHFRGMGIDTAVFDRSLPHVKEGFVAGLRGFLSFIGSTKPRICRLRRNRAAIEHVRSLMSEGLDAIVYEHISGWELVPPEAAGRIPVVCLTQNVETRIALDQFRFQHCASPLKIFFLGEYLKTLLYEKRMMKRITALISISENDAEWYSAAYPRARVITTDEQIPERSRCWQGSASGKRLLFIGSHRYFPNLDALRWLSGSLMPALRRLDDGISLSVCGLSEEEAAAFGLTCDGIDYLGFLPEEELAGLHCECDLYVCPIRLGSGIKMKILDALSYGMPVTAVSQSLAGIQVEGPAANLDFGDPAGSARRVATLLSDRAALREMSAVTIRSLEEYRRNRRRFDEAVLEAAGFGG